VNDFTGYEEIKARHTVNGTPNGSGPSRTSKTEPPWPEPLGSAAYQGLAGEMIRSLEPHTESDPAALLFQFIAVIGNCIGPRVWYPVEGARHAANLFVMIAGRTAKARKGTALNRVRGLSDATWDRERIASGLSSGEGLIERVRDRQTRREPDKRTGLTNEVEIDPGVSDKRLLVIEEEFSRPLRAMMRAENTLSSILRLCWDGRDLAILTRNTPVRATAPHVSIIGHITIPELRRELGEISAANGFANRFLFACAQRSKELPFGGEPDPEKIEGLRKRLAAVLTGQQCGPIQMDIAAKKLWVPTYSRLTRDQAGIFGAVTARAEAQVVRIALIYAQLDQAHIIGEAHLEAAIEIWRYAEASARHISGDAIGDPVADTILAALREAGPDGMTRTEISRLFDRNISSAKLIAALQTLVTLGVARPISRQTAGRPAEVWIAI